MPRVRPLPGVGVEQIRASMLWVSPGMSWRPYGDRIAVTVSMPLSVEVAPKW